jgi:hypothetical protein
MMVGGDERKTGDNKLLLQFQPISGHNTISGWITRRLWQLDWKLEEFWVIGRFLDIG